MVDFERFHLAAVTRRLEVSPAVERRANLLEFRMDLADRPLEALRAYDGNLPLLVTNRPEWEGGGRVDGPDRRSELEEALSVPAVEAVDLELRALDPSDGRPDLRPIREQARERGMSIVVSIHDFERTPSTETLRALAQKACQHGSLAKLAVTATDPEDVLRLLEVTDDLTTLGHTVGTMAMGAVGAHSRAIAPLYGSRLGYAPADSSRASAPGQFDLETLADLLSTFGVDRPKPTK
ncbi:MAG: type I 3-dehydroquinate dehydratase [Halodesulfurarchaeum sp.]